MGKKGKSKRIISLVVFAVIVFNFAFSLVGCGENLSNKYKDLKVGDTIEFGKNDDGNSIEWVVYNRDNSAVYITSLNTVAERPYFTQAQNIKSLNYDNSDLCLWLNGNLIPAGIELTEISQPVKPKASCKNALPFSYFVPNSAIFPTSVFL